MLNCKINFNLVFTWALMISFSAVGSTVAAQPRKSQVSDYELKTAAPKANLYSELIRDVDQTFAQTELAFAAGIKGNPQKIKLDGKPAGIIPSDVLNYLSALYLYCANNNGTCPEIINTVFQVDLINSVAGDKVSCINSLRFWKNWKDNDIDRRLEHNNKITHMNKVAKFNREERPDLIRCRQTITKQLKGKQKLTVLKESLLANKTNLENTVSLHKVSKRTNPDLLATVGLK